MEGITVVTEKAKTIWRDSTEKRPPRIVDLNYTFDFGKYAGWRLTDVAKINVDYLFWLHQKGAIYFTNEVIDEMPHYIIYSKWHYYNNKEDIKIEPIRRWDGVMLDFRKYERQLIKVPF